MLAWVVHKIQFCSAGDFCYLKILVNLGVRTLGLNVSYQGKALRL